MGDRPKISVIMPSLNVRRYIAQCMESVRGQTLRELEILCVDAGSDDGTVEYLETTAIEDPRVRVIHSDRRSYGYQVNLGLSEAKGEYITILDTDDYLSRDIYEEMYKVATADKDIDYVKGFTEYFYSLPGGEHIYRLRQLPQDFYVGGSAVISPQKHPELLQGDGFVWTGIYRADYMKRFRMHESPGAAFQDLGMILQLQMNGKKAVFMDKTGYHYRQDNMGASGYSSKGLSYVLNEYRWARSFVDNADDAWKCGFAKKFFLHFLSVLDTMARFGELYEDADESLNEIRNDTLEFLRLGWLRPKDFWDDLKEDILLLIGSPERVFEKHRGRFLAHMKLVREAEKKIQGKEVVMVGCGKIGRYMLDRSLYHGICNVIALADNSFDNIGTEIRTIPVYSVHEAARMYPEAMFLVANKNQYSEITTQLLCQGIPDERIVICSESYQDIASFAFR